MPGTIVGPINISHETWRQYDFGGRVYDIEHPDALYYFPGGTEDFVVKGSTVHVVPAPGVGGCVVRYLTQDNTIHFDSRS